MTSYSVDGQTYGVGLLPPDAPTLSHGDEITIADWVRVPVDLTPYDFEEGENVTSRDQRAFLSYTLSVTPGQRPYLAPTFAPPGPNAIEAKTYRSFFWIGEDLYQVTMDTSRESPWNHRFSQVHPRPPKLDPDGAYQVRTVILDVPSGQEQVVDIEAITGAQWQATRGTPLSTEDTGSAAGTWYRVELLTPESETVIESYETTAQ